MAAGKNEFVQKLEVEPIWSLWEILGSSHYRLIAYLSII